MVRSFFSRRDSGDEPGSPIPQLSQSFAERMGDTFDETRLRARRHGGRMPVAALPQLGRIEDIMLPLLAYLEEHPPSVDEEIAVQGIVTDYLPSTLDAFTRLPPDIANVPRADGRSPADDLIEQLVTLERASDDLSRAIYASDAEQLQTQGRFLRMKFEQSDLDL